MCDQAKHKVILIDAYDELRGAMEIGKVTLAIISDNSMDSNTMIKFLSTIKCHSIGVCILLSPENAR